MKALFNLCILLLLSPGVFAQTDCIKGDCKNGYGTCIFPSGAKYVGNFLEGRIHGSGIFYYSNGDKYIGNWENQVREGKGRMVFKNEDEYFGEFKANKFEGEGTMTYANGNKYEGQWSENLPNGQGVYIFANGDRYEGFFKNGQCAGNGIMYYADGSKFSGEWKKNMRHGQGTLTFNDGERVTGQWKEDQYMADWSKLSFEGDTTNLRNCNTERCLTGTGKFFYQDQSKFVGEFKDGLPEGYGTVYYANGDRFEGSWRRHAPHGRGVMYYESGKVIGAIWEYGKPVKKLFVKNNDSPEMVIKVDKDRAVKIWAVVVGAARYKHMPVLRYTDDDAYQIYAFLKSPEGGALPDKQLRLLIDEDANRSNIINAMRSVFLRADENDVIMFYFSGHGQQGAFLPIDFDGYNNRLEHEDIKGILEASGAKHKVVLADACHSGSLLAIKATPINATLEKYYKAFETTSGGMALMMSSKGEEYSLEDGGLRSGIFSHFLVRGLKGDADASNDQIVSIQELFNYVHKNVRVYTGNAQTPTLTGEFDGKMPIAVVRD